MAWSKSSVGTVGGRHCGYRRREETITREKMWEEEMGNSDLICLKFLSALAGHAMPWKPMQVHIDGSQSDSAIQ